MKARRSTYITAGFSLAVLIVMGYSCFVLGKATVASRIEGTVEVNGRLVANAEVYRTNMNAPIVCIDSNCYLLSPFQLIKGGVFWRVGGNLIAFRELYSNTDDIFIATYKWGGEYDPRLTPHEDESITFTDPEGAEVRVRMAPMPSIKWD